MKNQPLDLMERISVNNTPAKNQDLLQSYINRSETKVNIDRTVFVKTVEEKKELSNRKTLYKALYKDKPFSISTSLLDMKVKN